MREIAAELGVSTTTISKVLNNHADIGKETRARVLERVAQLGYQPNAVARSLTLRRTHTLGVVVPHLLHSFFTEVVTAIEGFVSAKGYGLLVCNLAGDPEKERRQLEMLLQRQVDGVILASSAPDSNADLLGRLANQNKGLVLVDRDDHARLACHRVLTDDAEVGRLAAAHLADLGHRRIAPVHVRGLSHSTRREEGFKQEMARRGLEVLQAWTVSGTSLENGGSEGLKQRLADAPDVTGLFVMNDPGGIGAMKAVWAAGRRVPDDISIVGAGDIALGEMLRVPLTTVGWSRQEMGEAAARLILDQLERSPSGPFERHVVPPSLIVRASTAPAAAPPLRT